VTAARAVERAAGPSRGARAVLDIGPHAGALVVFAPAHLDQHEVEIRHSSDVWRGQHTAIRARHLPGRTVYAGLFDRLPPGGYDLRLRKSESDNPEGGVATRVVGTNRTDVTREFEVTTRALVTAGTVTEVNLALRSSPGGASGRAWFARTGRMGGTLRV
jgi:hypothetical protein